MIAAVVSLFSPLPHPPLHLLHVRNVCMNPIQIISRREREQQQDVVDGNLIRGEQGVCNAAHVPGSCLIAFGLVQIWSLLREKSKLPSDGSLLFRSRFFRLPLSFNVWFQRVLRERWDTAGSLNASVAAVGREL